jgi:hypothetical protein
MRNRRIIALIGFAVLMAINPAVRAGVEESVTDISRRRTNEATVRTTYSDAPQLIREATDAIERIRNKVEEWGVVTISAPVAVIDSRAFLVPPDIRSTTALFDDANADVAATASQFTGTALGNQTGVVVTPAVPGATTVPPGGSTTSTTTTSTTNPSDVSVPSLPTADGLGLPNTFSAPGISTPVVKSVSARLREAEDNTVKQKIYSEMTKPIGIPGHDQVIFAIVQVSCNPGWRTQQKYIADGSASVEFYDMLSQQHYPRNFQRAPTVFSVLPLMDAQTIEMANSQKEVTQLAFQLAASLPAKGVNINAKNLFQFVRQYARELKSVTPIPVVNSYSSGKTFGFRFSPSFQALRDPAQKNSRAANVLLPTTFPALVTVIIHDDDLRAVASWYGKSHADWTGDSAPSVALLTHISTRWYLKERPPLSQFLKRLFTPLKRDSADIEIDIARDVKLMNDAKSAYRNRNGSGLEAGFDPIYDELHREVIDLQSKGTGQSWPIQIDAAFLAANRTENARVHARLDHKETQNDLMRDLQEQVDMLKLQEQTEILKKKISAPATEPSIDKIDPVEVVLDVSGGGGEFKFIIFGKGLDRLKTAYLGDVKATTIESIGGSLVVSFKLASANEGDKRDLKLFDAKGGGVIAEKAVTLHVIKKPEDPKVTPSGSASPSPSVSPKGEENKKTDKNTPAITPTPIPTSTPNATSKAGVTPDGTATSELTG